MAFLTLFALLLIPFVFGQENPFNMPFNDRSGGLQWYINTDHENHYNVKDVWRMNYTGAKVVVAVVDEGLSPTHPELSKNYDRNASYDFVDDDEDPLPKLDKHRRHMTGHGSNCAGVIAAEGNNRQCGVGLAYNARIGGIRLFVDEKAPDDKEAKALKFKRDYIDIYSNSWGPSDKGFEVEGPGSKTLKALKEGAEEGREGKGSIFVFAAGNGGIIARDSCAFNGYVNSIYTIAITGIKRDGTVPSYGERCPGIMAVTYSRDMFGDRNPVVTAGQNGKCEFHFGGSSAATAMASGLIALTLEANQNLTWRDLQHIIVRSARFPGRKPSDLVTNGVGLKVSNYMGFGLMDALKMVTYAKGWKSVPVQQRCEIFRSPKTSNQMTVDLSSWPKNCGRRIRFLEHVQVRVNLKVWPRGDLLLTLQSPDGTESRLTQYRPMDRFRGHSTNLTDWVILSLHHWGEDPTGPWKLTWNKGELYNWTLVLFGTSSDPLKDNGHVRDAVVPKQLVKNSEKTGYIVQLTTTHLLYPSTLANAGIKLFGVSGQTEEHSLTPDRKMSSVGRSHLFYVHARTVGNLWKVCMYRHDTNYNRRFSWKLYNVAVRPDGDQSWIVLPYNRFIHRTQSPICLIRACRKGFQRNNVGQCVAACPVGFERNKAGQCVDIDECAKGTDDCQQSCQNNQGGYKCYCRSGYYQHWFYNKRCIDIDECAINKGGCEQNCNNLLGTYQCSCNSGYHKISTNSKRCKDIDECAINNGGCEQKCKNLPGTYECYCNNGYSKSTDSKKCVDIDECAINNGGCEQNCNNLPGTYECYCNSGYSKSTDSKRCIANLAPRSRPKTCKDLQRPGQANMPDGEYRIYPLKDCNISISVYCRGMTTTDPKEYLTVGDGTFLLDWRKTAIFNKVRLDPVKMLIIRNDNHFAESRSHYYGSAKTCCPDNGAQCKHTWFTINLSDTGLKFKKQARWGTTGRTQIAKNLPNEKDGIYFVSYKGSCGEGRLSDDLSLSIIGC